MGTAQPDQELVAKARGGDRAAFDALVLRYQKLAVMAASSIVRNFELAKDVSQNAFAKAYFELGHFRSEASFKTWFFRILYNEAKQAMRKERFRNFHPFYRSEEAREESSEHSILEIVPSGERSPDEAAEQSELKQRLEEAIGRLPDREREAFVLRYLNGFTLAEIADIQKVRLGTIKAHLAHGTQKIKTMLGAGAGQAPAGKAERVNLRKGD